MLNQMKFNREESMKKPIKINIHYKTENKQKIEQTQYVNIYTTMGSIIARFLYEKLGEKNYTKQSQLYELWFKGVPVDDLDTIDKIKAKNNDNFRLERKPEDDGEYTEKTYKNDNTRLKTETTKMTTTKKKEPKQNDNDLLTTIN